MRSRSILSYRQPDTRMLEDGRKAPTDRLMQNAHVMGADAVLKVRFASSGIARAMSEGVACGMACVLGDD